ncbi:MAG: hypothetical protein M3416_00770 [Acidobacteriota bacterium]|nr:hypothetical protein [Acidobacteriota bacterium]
MTDRIARLKHNRRAPRVAILLACALVVLCYAEDASAQWATSGANITNTNAGNVGVGTAAPTSKLEVSDSSSNGVAAKFVQSNAAASNGLVIQTQTASPNDISLLVTSNAGATAGLVVRNTGNVGIGTTAPGTFGTGITASGRMLHVANGAGHAQLILGTAGAGNLATINMEVGDATAGKRVFQTRYDGANNIVRSFFFNESSGAVTQDNVLVLKNNGNVGIGTVAPATKLDVADAVHNGVAAKFVQSNAAASNGVYIQTQTASESDMALYVVSNAGATTGLAVRNTGNVGIGTANPTTKLHVAGDIRVDGNISAKYQDVAEWVPSRQRLAAGTVVVVDPAGVNGVLASASAYDTGVAGVVSAQPGLILGDAGEGKVKVATTGRVRVKVDATRAPVRAGDLLVSSEREGYAMKSQPVRIGRRKIHSPGTIIGKALEPLEKGTGEILVLLSLQ